MSGGRGVTWLLLNISTADPKDTKNENAYYFYILVNIIRAKLQKKEVNEIWANRTIFEFYFLI